MTDNEGISVPGEGRDYETEAKEQGWTPESEFRGDPNKWVDAQTFVERGENFLPLVKKKLEKSQDEVGSLRGKLTDLEKQLKTQSEDMSASFKKQLETHKKLTEFALKKQKEDISARYEEAKRQAVNEGDIEEYDRLNKEHQQKQAEFSEPEFEAEVDELEVEKPKDEPKQQNELTQAQRDTISAWEKENSWFKDDEDLADFARIKHRKIHEQNPDISLEESLKQVSEIVKKKFPSYFEDFEQPSVITGGSRSNGSGAPIKKGWNQLPQEAKDNADYYINDLKTFKNRDEFAAHYWEFNDE